MVNPEAAGSYDSTTFFYQTPGTETQYVTFAGYLRNKANVSKVEIDNPDGTTTEYLSQRNDLERGVFAFGETMPLVVGGTSVTLGYHGRGHTLDNIVAWLPKEKILFAGCMCKSAHSKTLGWTGDADLEAWPKTIEAVYRAYPSARTVIPGHGATGGRELLRHTLKLLRK